ncbi:MAG: peroxidase-related enzyme [Aestuariivirgaceae bacterium]
MTKQTCWIDLIEDQEAGEDLKAAYDSLRREDGAIHNLYRAFSQFPQPVVAADRFYKDIMHAPDAPLPMWLAELLSVDVAILNGCRYAETHHGENFLHLFEDRKTATRMLEALHRDDLGSSLFDDKVRKLLEYGRKLTRHPDRMTSRDIEGLRRAGFSDAEISQAVQVTASFAYWTRFINALGIEVGDEKVGKY